MASVAHASIDAVFADARLAAARGMVRQLSPAEHADESELLRYKAGVLALAGSERGFAEVADAELLSCRDEASLAQYVIALDGRARWYDRAAAAVVASWSGDELTTYACWRDVRESALAEGRAPTAVAAAERLGHYALLFGDVGTARKALDDALTLAQAEGLRNWWLRCAAASAQLTFNVGDAAQAAALLDQACPQTLPSHLRALFAPVAAALATAGRNAAGDWTSPDLLEIALHDDDTSTAAAATTAFLLVSGPPAPGSHISGALRRALLQADGAAGNVDLFALAARYGDGDDARLGVDTLRAMLAPHRPYLEAHFLLARAYWSFRFGERTDAIDSAGDAARAFDGMGLRRWTDDAMLVLVHQEGISDTHRRRRATAFSLTGREQQVAHLIRRGASNREVARTLQISEHTVERHVSSILSRLGLRSRWQIVDARNSGTEH
ncbi:MAG: helix-turn-helix transcriptional regulator [Candidatus Eremiobacteraeota bacterium]|nr:helix-turn-helix transcriptional regulator [Candidatus Eremiobacteraeota bacterium]